MATAKFKHMDRLNVLSLIPSPDHPRNHPDENSEEADKKLKGMKANIRKTGMIDPVTVVKVDERTYHIIDGVQRVRAAEQLEINYINCIVYHGISDAESAHLSYQLNSIHPSKPLTSDEKALHLKKMADEFGCSYSDLEKMGYGSKSELMSVISLLDSSTEPAIKNVTFGAVTSKSLTAENQLLTSGIYLIHHGWSSAVNGIKAPIFMGRKRNFGNYPYIPNFQLNKIQKHANCL